VDLYTTTSYELSERITLRYSTSFSKSSRLFSAKIRPHIFAIYGLVRIADEIVDTYDGTDKQAQLDALERETYHALKVGYSTNPIVHSFACTATAYGITKELIDPFFKSMHMDLTPQNYNESLYQKYIYGSAEVIGLMCLRVFSENTQTTYAQLESGAKALGAAYQKVNFLRDIASDYKERGRVYFPNVQFESFSDSEKETIITDIQADFSAAKPYIDKLPKNARKAVGLSYAYYHELLKKLAATPVHHLKQQRIRLSNIQKAHIALAHFRLEKGDQ
jgi:phytoene/squalene synthetase